MALTNYVKEGLSLDLSKLLGQGDLDNMSHVNYIPLEFGLEVNFSETTKT